MQFDISVPNYPEGKFKLKFICSDQCNFGIDMAYKHIYVSDKSLVSTLSETSHIKLSTRKTFFIFITECKAFAVNDF